MRVEGRREGRKGREYPSGCVRRDRGGRGTKALAGPCPPPRPVSTIQSTSVSGHWSS